MSFSQSWSISFKHLSAPCLYKYGQFFIHLRVIYTIVVDFYKFEGSFIHLWKFINLRVQQGHLSVCT